MTRLFYSVCLALVLVGCAQPKPQLVQVWGVGESPEDAPTPPGFKVTPAGAYRAVADSHRLSLKHNWACYHDDRNYYVFDSFITKATPENALRHGVRVNGETGAMPDRQTAE